MPTDNSSNILAQFFNSSFWIWSPSYLSDFLLRTYIRLCHHQYLQPLHSPNSINSFSEFHLFPDPFLQKSFSFIKTVNSVTPSLFNIFHLHDLLSFPLTWIKFHSQSFYSLSSINTQFSCPLKSLLHSFDKTTNLRKTNYLCPLQLYKKKKKKEHS